MNKMKLGLLDLGTGSAPNMLAILENIVNYAETAEKLGFSRFWLAEHYLVGNVAWYSPEALIPIIAGMTKDIKVGIAGILLSYENPYRVALQYKMLSNLFPDRIDLGLANGGVPEPIRNLLLPELDKFPHQIPNYFNDKLTSLANLINNEPLAENLPLVPPYKGVTPNLWYLGIRHTGLKMALDLKLNFSKSLFHTYTDDLYHEKEKLAEFKEAFYEKYNVYPSVNIAFSGLCHKTTDKARQTRAKQLEGGNTYSYNELVGCPNYIFDEVSKLHEAYQVDEFIFFNKAISNKDRLIGIELLADKFSLAS